MRKHKIWDFDYDYLQSVLNESLSYKDVCQKLGFTLSKSVIKMIKYRIKIDELAVDVFRENVKKNRGLDFRQPQSLESILVENSTYTTTNSLKKKLVKAGLLKYECVECKNDGFWNEKKLVLQLDHINGKSCDNRIENLRILCPNCHTQTHTYAGKKKKIKPAQIICKNCDNESNGKVFCDECQETFAAKKRKVERPSIEILKIEIEQLGYSGVGRKYGVSDNAIRKWIKNRVVV